MIIPCLRYRRALAAVEWLGKAFGFEKQFVHTAADGEVEHAQLILGQGMIMVGPARDNEFGKLLRQPGELGGFVTQSIYVVVPDPDAVHTRARAAGAEIVKEPIDQPYGGRDFTCRDPEGHVWTFGSYDPLSINQAGS